MEDEFIAQAGAKIFAQRLSEAPKEPLPTPVRPDKISWEGISLHEAFIDRMSDVRWNVMGVQVQHLYAEQGGIKPNYSMEMLPEVRVFADVMAEQGAESKIYDSLIATAAMVADEEQGKLGYQVAQEELDRRPDMVAQGLKHGDWIRKPALYDKVSSAFEGALKKLAESPELQYKLEWVIENKTLPLIDKLTEESMSLGSTVRYYSDNEEFKDIENLLGKLSAFAKISYLSTVNEWAKQNGLPQLDLNKHLPQEFQEITSVATNVPADQLQFARETVAAISPNGKVPVDKSAIVGDQQENQKELATINSR